MAILSNPVSAGDSILASAYNNLRIDLLTGAITIAGVKTFSSIPVFSEGISIPTNKNFYLSAASYIKHDGSVIWLYPEGTSSMYFHATHAACVQDFVMFAGKKHYMDTMSGHTYHVEYADNEWRFYVGNVNIMTLFPSCIYTYGHLSVEPGKKVFLDGGGDTYDIESSANVRDFYTGGVIALRLDASQNTIMYGNATISKTDPTLSFYNSGYSSHPYFKFRVFNQTFALYYQDDSTAETLRYYFNNSGTAYADVGWSTFSPDIKKDNEYKGKEELTSKDYLDWALKDAKKPLKPYAGIKGTSEEISQYGKDICKISIGLAHWAEEAEKRISQLEEALKQ